MSKRAWAYVWFVLLLGAVLVGHAFLELPSPAELLPFAVLTALAILAHLFKAEAPNHQLYYTNLVFFFAGLLLLHPLPYVLLVIVPLLIEWIKERVVDSPHLRAWYLQPFNIATYLVAGFAARSITLMLGISAASLHTTVAVIGATIAAIVYVILNHFLIGLALVLARGVPWHESRILAIENLLTDYVLSYLGYIVAVLWTLNPWLILPVLSALLLISRALSVPRLKREAQTDEKTGLWNARHFARLFAAEVERSSRYRRPLAVLMTDLDLLRNINNTYGHLAGDAVLAGVGKIIRETIREYDIAGRFGGEEFAIVLPEANREEARAIAERLRQAVAAAAFSVTTNSTPIHATLSIGVAAFPQDAVTVMELIHEADVAVYQAKLEGRNRVVCASDVPHSFRLENRSMQDRLAMPYVSRLARGTDEVRRGPADASAHA